MLVAILVSFSRGAYIALFVFFAMLITFFCIYKRDMLKKALAICLCVWLPTLLCMLPERKSVLITCFMNHTVSQQRSTAGRFVKWKEAINIFGLFPATGVGGGNYALASDTYRQERQGLFTSYATNTYLQVAAEKGIVGVIVYGCIGFVAYIHWNTPNEKRRIEINCIFLYFAGIRRKGSYILFFFSEREYDDTLFPDNG